TGAEEANTARDCGCESRAHPGYASCPCQATSADVRATQGDEGRAKAKDERNLQIFQARAYTIARQSECPKGADEAGQKYDIEISEHGIERNGQCDAQDFREERSLPAHLKERQPYQTAARVQICD